MLGSRCTVCGSEDLVMTSAITITGHRESVTVAEGVQCTLCGRLEVMIPQPVLVRWYPPGLRYLTWARRERLARRRKERRRIKSREPALQRLAET